MTNGDSRFDMDVCRNCAQPYRSGHVDCTCPQNHPERCERPTYEDLTDILEHVMPVYDLFEYPREPEEILANARRIAGENADIALKAMGRWAECSQKLTDIVDAVDDEEAFYITVVPDHLIEPARALLEKQKVEKVI